MIYKWRELTQNLGYAICSTGAYGAMARIESRETAGSLFIYLQLFKHGNISTIALRYLKVIIQVLIK